MATACIHRGVYTRASSNIERRSKSTGVYRLRNASQPVATSSRLSGRNASFNSTTPLFSSRAEPVVASRASRLPVVAQTEETHSIANTLRRALNINLDPSIYGSFAEIGAGQEVARMFFAAGGAAGTVAKSVSAYDMTISDTFYGRADRYVTKERLEAMLEYEYIQCSLPLKNARGDTTRFFAFADTVVAKAYNRDNECHGWMGVKWQTEPNRPPNRIMIHLRLLDPTATMQQEALGVLGVNFLHMAFNRWEDIASSISGAQDALRELMVDLGRESVEVDLIEISGPDFDKVDNRSLALQLVEVNLTDAVLFNSCGEVTIPTDYFRKKNVLVQRGNFRPPTIITADMLGSAAEQIFCASMDENGHSIDTETCVVQSDSRVCLEITLKDLREGGDGLNWCEDYPSFLKRESKDFLDRVDTITAMGFPCLVSNYFEYFKLSGYLRRATPGAIVIAMGVPAVQELFNDKYYAHLEGGIMENFGRLSTAGLKIYVYPSLDKNGEVMTGKNLKLNKESSQPLYDFMYSQGTIEEIDGYDVEVLRKMAAAPAPVMKMLKNNTPGWEELVPPAVAETIKKGQLFNVQA